jgi:HK97 family phage portal protein
MNIWPFNRPKSVKTSVSTQILTQKHAFPTDNLKAYADEGYGLNPTVFACIDLISKSFARVPLKVMTKGDKPEHLTEHPLQKLIDQPNPDEGGVEYRQAACSWLMITGNNFQQKLKASGLPSELIHWQPYEFSIDRLVGNMVPLRYIYGKNQRYERIFEVDQFTGKSDLMQWRTFNPSATGAEFGQAPLKAAASCVDSSNAARLWNYSALQNSGSYSLVVTSDTPPTGDQEKTILQDIKEKWEGPENARKVKYMGSASKIDTISMTPQDMDWLEGLKLNAQEICSAFGVPTQLISIEGSQTYANYEEAKVAFFVQTIMPLLDLYVSELNRWLTPDFGENVEIVYCEDDIPALEPLRREKRAELVSSDVLTINEKRAILGFEPIDSEEADQVFVQPNDIPLDETFSDMDEEEIDEDDDDGEETTGEE